MIKIMALAGRKQSGKNSIFNVILGVEMLKLAIVRDKIVIANDGKLWVSDIFGDSEHEGIFDPDRQNEAMLDFLDEYVNPYIKSYSFADALKRSVCMDILGLQFHSCFGTDEEKNKPTHLLWENMPGIISDKGLSDLPYTREVRARLGKTNLDRIIGSDGLIKYHSPGVMTGREVMQYVGTEIFRKMYNDVWADSCVKKIEKENSLFAIITDCRFPSEVEAVQKAGGKVVRLTRGMSNTDVHSSETALDPDVYDWNNFDAIIDNKDMTIGEQNKAILQMLRQWEWIDQVDEEKITQEKETE